MLAKLLGGDLVKSVGGIIDSLHTSQEEKDNAKIKLQALENELKTKQIDVNKVEAGHRSIFVAGWRPFLGWVSGISVAFVYLFQPFIVMVLKIFGSDIELPTLDLSQLMPLILGMLGLGGLRSFEKARGISK
jgi:hypothetical protein|tara:strand:+ start:104 stop:499 length:396 start_codon:yes stop_codon:yes gene_type:complete